MSKRLEEIAEGTKVMKDMFSNPDFKLETFKFDVLIEDMEYIIAQNKRYRETLLDLQDLKEQVTLGEYVDAVETMIKEALEGDPHESS